MILIDENKLTYGLLEMLIKEPISISIIKLQRGQYRFSRKKKAKVERQYKLYEIKRE